MIEPKKNAEESEWLDTVESLTPAIAEMKFGLGQSWEEVLDDLDQIRENGERQKLYE